MEVYGTRLGSRLLLGTAQYPSPAILAEAVRASGAEVVTVSIRRESGAARAGQGFWSLIRELGVRVLPNTAGCHSAKEAVATARMARELFGTPWIKLEVIGDADLLQPGERVAERSGHGQPLARRRDRLELQAAQPAQLLDDALQHDGA